MILCATNQQVERSFAVFTFYSTSIGLLVSNNHVITLLLSAWPSVQTNQPRVWLRQSAALLNCLCSERDRFTRSNVVTI